MKTKVFFVEPTDRVVVYLRRYRTSTKPDSKCKCSDTSYHNAMTLLDERTGDYAERDDGRGGRVLRPVAMLDPADPRWPTKCQCGYEFEPDDNWQMFQEEIYVRPDTGEEHSLRRLPIGAMYYADWMISAGSQRHRGPDGRCLVVMVPGRDMQPTQWMVDTRANNCDMPDDHEHRCWVRHGDVRTGDVHVDKDGHTCGAGGGSIQTSGWHGFLSHGYLQEQR